jgi:hypothetical protein
MKVLLVDGYNLIYGHPRLSGLVDRDPDSAREGLLKELSCLASPNYYQLVMVVFDAAGSRRPEPVIEDRGGITVVFTRRSQSADSFIEAAVRRLVPGSEVEVATSDRVLANMVAGFGARSVDGASMLGMAQEALIETRGEMRRLPGSRRAPLEDRVSEEVRHLLDQMRYQ